MCIENRINQFRRQVHPKRPFCPIICYILKVNDSLQRDWAIKYALFYILCFLFPFMAKRIKTVAIINYAKKGDIKKERPWLGLNRNCSLAGSYFLTLSIS